MISLFMKKVLCIGDTAVDTDHKVTELARISGTKNHGLVIDIDQDLSKYGYYHTTLIDLTAGNIIKIVDKFDEVQLLDQPESEWTDSKLFLSSYKLIKEIERQSNKLAVRVKYGKNINHIDYWTRLFKENKSICLMPWIMVNTESGTGTNLTPCPRSDTVIKDFKEINDWQTDPDLVSLRNKFKQGKRINKVCDLCYRYEDRGLTGYRTHDSLDWVAKLGLKSLDDLDNIKNPFVYHLRLSNKCNLMCRMCTPVHSHLLHEEFQQWPELIGQGQTFDDNYAYSDINIVDINNLSSKHFLYLTGGEPTVMKEVYSFMRKCIERGKTDFYFSMTTNGQNLNPVFMDLAAKFSKLHFSVSIDGLGKVNDYIRWLSDWETLIENCHRLRDQGHIISWNHVPTIWGIHRSHELFEFISKEFTDVHLYLQYNRVSLHSAFRSPLVKETIESMKRCQQTAVYYNDGKDCKSGIDSFLEHYKSYDVDKEHLKKFFAWNDLMDRARNIKLKDYIPELDACREMIQ